MVLSTTHQAAQRNPVSVHHLIMLCMKLGFISAVVLA